jgi:hypothetical protein
MQIFGDMYELSVFREGRFVTLRHSMRRRPRRKTPYQPSWYSEAGWTEPPGSSVRKQYSKKLGHQVKIA